MPEHKAEGHLMKSKSPCCHFFFTPSSTSLLTNLFVESPPSNSRTYLLERHAVERRSILA